MQTYKLICKSAELTFAAAHMLKDHEKCSRLHGHNYRVKAIIETDFLHNGMVIDFGIVKRILKEIIEPFDHKFIVAKYDKDYRLVEKKEGDKILVNEFTSLLHISGAVIPWDMVHRLTVMHSGQTTTERIASEILYLFIKELKKRSEELQLSRISAVTISISESDGNEVEVTNTNIWREM